MAVLFAHVQHGLGGGFYFAAGLVFGSVFRLPLRGKGEGEIVVHQRVGIAVAAFQASCHDAHKGVVHGGHQNAEVVKRGVWQAEIGVAVDDV